MSGTMSASSYLRHVLHVAIFLSLVVAFEIMVGGIPWLDDFRKETVEPWSQYGTLGAILLYGVRLLTLLPLPLCLFQVLGLTLYNGFPTRPVLKGSPLLSPFICVRVVTRGDFPHLVQRNVLRNLTTCLDLGMDKFMIEVVTDRAIHLSADPRVREVVVPSSYHTKQKSLFKARALQYCNEPDVNTLNPDDWIVHLDEETIMTESSVKGILNFAIDGRHDFGQGLITYANEEVVNWVTTLADMFRVADDMGKLRFQFKFFHRPIFSWKGSYVVTRARAEHAVTYDNGPRGSVAEDCYFAMKAMSRGHTFDFIEGEMWEKSPFTVWDFLQQRKRWMQGIWLVVHDPSLDLKPKIWLSIFLYSWVTVPITTSNIIWAALYPIPCPPLMDFLTAFIGATQLYMYVFGVMKSFSHARVGVLRCALLVLGSLCTIPFNIVIENMAVIWGLFGNKQSFYVVSKEFKTHTQLNPA